MKTLLLSIAMLIGLAGCTTYHVQHDDDRCYHPRYDSCGRWEHHYYR